MALAVHGWTTATHGVHAPAMPRARTSPAGTKHPVFEAVPPCPIARPAAYVL